LRVWIYFLITLAPLWKKYSVMCDTRSLIYKSLSTLLKVELFGHKRQPYLQLSKNKIFGSIVEEVQYRESSRGLVSMASLSRTKLLPKTRGREETVKGVRFTNPLHSNKG
jgi:hypothetical protein